MAIKDSHGVVVSFYGQDGKLGPAIHKPDQYHGPHALRTNYWEHFPSLQVALEAQQWPCQVVSPA